MFEVDDYVVIVAVNDDIIDELGWSENEILSKTFYIKSIDHSNNVFPYLLEDFGSGESVIWVGEDEIDYA